MATSVDTSTSVLATYGPRATAVTSGGTDWVALYSLADTRFEFWYSTDNGTSWTEATTLRQTVIGTFDGGLTFFIDWDDFATFTYTTSTEAAVYWTAGELTSTATWTSIGGVLNGATWSPTPNAVDVVMFQATSTTRRVAWVAQGDDLTVFWQDFLLSTNATSGSVGSRRIDSAPLTTAQFVALDFKHSGDGVTKTADNADLFVAWRDTASTAFTRLYWSASTYALGTQRDLEASAAAASDALAGVFDGSRFVAAFIDDGSDTVVQVFERDAADTTTTERTPPALSDGAITSISVSYNSEGDIVLGAVGTTSDDPKYVVYDRSGDSWGSWTTIEASTATEGTFSLQRGYQSDGVNTVWSSGSGSPYTVTFERIPFNTAPLAPTWLTPPTGSAQDETATLAVTWQFNDSPGDTQSAYALKRVISSTTTYYRASDQTWQVAEVKNTSSTNGVTLPNTWGADGESVALTVKTWDAADTEGVYGSTLTLLGSTPVTPALTAPTDAGTITTSKVTATWTATEQTARRLRILDSAGTVQLYDSGKVTTTTKTTEIDYTLTNSTTYKVEVRVWNDDDLEGPVDTHTFTTGFTAPATPTLVVTAEPSSGRNKVVITNPAPTGGQPTVTSHDLFVRVASGGVQDRERTVNDSGIRIIAGDAATTLYDYAAASGVSYEYLVRAHASSNGTSKDSAWT